MNKNILRYIRVGVVAFWIPLVLIAYSLKFVWPIVGKISKPISRLLPFQHVAGEIADFIIGVLIILLITIVVGLIMQKTVLRSWTRRVDGLLTRLFPGYSFYKNFLSDATDDEQKGWKSVIVKDEEDSKLGFVVDEHDGICTVYIPAAPNPYEGEVVFKKRELLHPVDVTFVQAVGIIRRYGKGFSVTENLKPE